MKHNIKYILSVCIGIALTMGLSAQTLNSSYFMEKMTKRNQLNPALKTPNGYVSFPALGNFYLGVNSNLGLGTFLYPSGNELVTFLDPSVPADDFLGKLTPNNTVELDLGLDIISFGFWAWGGQNTFNLALKSYSGAYMPKEIFQFLKTGQKETGITRYDMSNITVSTDNYVELALGHARDSWSQSKSAGRCGTCRSKDRSHGYIHVPRRMVHQTSRTYTSLFPPEIRDRSRDRRNHRLRHRRFRCGRLRTGIRFRGDLRADR